MSDSTVVGRIEFGPAMRMSRLRGDVKLVVPSGGTETALAKAEAEIDRLRAEIADVKRVGLAEVARVTEMAQRIASERDTLRAAIKAWVEADEDPHGTGKELLEAEARLRALVEG